MHRGKHRHTHGSSHNMPHIKQQPRDLEGYRKPRPRHSSLARTRARPRPPLGPASRRPSLFSRMPLAAHRKTAPDTHRHHNSTRNFAAFGLCSRLFYIIQYLFHFYAITQRFVRLGTSRAIEELSAHGQYAHELDEAGLVLGNHARARSASAPRASGAFQCPQ